MKHKYFYSHLIKIDSVIVELGKLEMNDAQREHLVNLMHSNLHHLILDMILTELTEDDKKIFLENITRDDHEKTWQHLIEKIEKINEKIQSVVNNLKKSLHEDLKELSKNS